MRGGLLVCLGLSTSVLLDICADSEPGDSSSSLNPLLQPTTTAPPVVPAEPIWFGVGQPESSSCRDVDMSVFAKGFLCGPPLSQPCFATSVYIYDSECSLLDSSTLQEQDGAEQVDGSRMNHHYLEWALRNEARDAGMLAATYESACIYVHVGIGGAGEACAVRSPRWNKGSHHLMIDMSDDGRNHRPTIAHSCAMEASSNMHTCFYREGYDISISLAPEHVFHDLARIAPWDRKFLLTVKCAVYLSNRGSEERMSLVPIHDEERGVVISMHCFENHGEHLLPENAKYCQSLRDRYNDYDYDTLMNTTFGLVPAGRSPGTFRLGEVMSAGAIPVFVGRDIVPAFRERFDWPSFSFAFTPDEVGIYMLTTLRAVPQAKLEEMQRKSLEAYLEIFGTDANDFRPSARILLDILQKRLEQRGGVLTPPPGRHAARNIVCAAVVMVAVYLSFRLQTAWKRSYIVALVGGSAPSARLLRLFCACAFTYATLVVGYTRIVSEVG